MHLVGNSKQEELTWRQGIDEGHILSPDDESVDEGEYESEGIGGLSFNEMGVVILAAGHGSASHESSGTVSADTWQRVLAESRWCEGRRSSRTCALRIP